MIFRNYSCFYVFQQYSVLNVKENCFLFVFVQIDREYTHFVLKRSDGNTSLLELDAIRAMCDLEMKLTTIGGYKGICQVKFYSKKCCRPWSIPNYIALLANRTSCSDIQVCLTI